MNDHNDRPNDLPPVIRGLANGFAIAGLMWGAIALAAWEMFG
jgi:hypothetical protein